MCKLSLFFIDFFPFVILVSLMSDIKRPTDCFFSSTSFVYSVIINQPGCITAFQAQTDTKDTWKGYNGWKEKGRGWQEEVVIEIEEQGFLKGRNSVYMN